jgi:hypothetical protein
VREAILVIRTIGAGALIGMIVVVAALGSDDA